MENKNKFKDGDFFNNLSHFDILDWKIKKSKYVYFLTDFNNNTKIGRSDDPIKRAKDISSQSNKLIFPILIGIPIVNGNKGENVLHQMFKNKRIKIQNTKTECFSIEAYKLICMLMPNIMDYFKMAWVFNPKEKRYVPLFQGMIEMGAIPKELND